MIIRFLEDALSRGMFHCAFQDNSWPAQMMITIMQFLEKSGTGLKEYF